MFTNLEKHLILALAIALWAGGLVFLTISRLGGSIPERPTLPLYAFRSYRAIKSRPINRLITPRVFTSLQPAVQLANPFYSIQLYPPTPPPPKTRKAEVLFQGYFMTSHGEKYAYLMVDNKLLVGMVGTKAVANLSVADMNPAGLTLKDDTGKETFLPFNTKQNVEVPVQ